jgi:TIR domain
MSNESEPNVFLCHNSEDKSIVRAIAGALKEVDIKYWLDEGELIPGRLWEPAIKEEISAIKSAAIFIGGNGFGAYQKTELTDFLAQAQNRECPIIPVFLPKVKSNKSSLLESITDTKLKEIIENLLDRTWVDLNDEDNGVSNLIHGITGNQPDSTMANLAQLHYRTHLTSSGFCFKVLEAV